MRHPQALIDFQRLIDEGKTREQIQSMLGISRRTFYRILDEVRNPKPKPQRPVVAIRVEERSTQESLVLPSERESRSHDLAVLENLGESSKLPESGKFPESGKCPQVPTVTGPKLIPIENCVPDASVLHRRKQQEIHDRNKDECFAGIEHSAARQVMQERERRRNNGGLEDLH